MTNIRIRTLKQLAISLTLLAVLFLGVFFWVAKTGFDAFAEQQAMDELNKSTQAEAVFLAHSIEQQYAPLEALAEYLSVQDDPKAAFLAATDHSNAIVFGGTLCLLGYADLKGNASSHMGESLGSVSERAFFTNVTSQKNNRSIEYADNTTLTTVPHITFGVPVLKNNEYLGVLFASMEISDFKNAALSEDLNGKMSTLVTDGNGTLIVIRGTNTNRFETGNLFDEYSTNAMSKQFSQENVLADMQAYQSGQFYTNNEYISYMPVGVNDWYVFGSVDKIEALTGYTAYAQHFTRVALISACVFAVFFILALILTTSVFRKTDKQRVSAQKQSVHYKTALSTIESAAFNYDVATQNIEFYESFEHLFGYYLPQDWARSLKNRSIEHPEVDYEAIAQAKSKVELTGESTQVEFQAFNKDKELRWLRIIMAPLYKESRQLTSIVGLVIDVTDSHDKERATTLEQERLTLAIKNLAPLVISCNLTQNIYRMINYDNFTTKVAPDRGIFDELVSTEATTVPEDDRQGFINAFSRENLLAAHKHGEEKIEVDHRQVGDDGITRWMRTWMLFVNNSYDNDVYAITLSRDITDKKQYEALLQKTIDLTIQNMPSYVGKWMFKDGDVLLIDANKGYLSFLNATEETALGKSVFGCFEDDEKQEILMRLYDCEKDKKPIISTNRACRKSGENCWVKIQASFFEEQDGYSVYYGTVTDITEQIAVQERLSQTLAELGSAYAKVASVNVYRDLMNISQSGGMIVRTLWDDPQRFLYISPGILNISGYTEEEFSQCINGRSFSFLHPDDIPRIDETNQTLLDIGDSFTLDFRMQHKDGHYLWVVEHAMVATLPNEEKVITSLIADISEQKELEEKLRISQEEYRIAASLSNQAVLSYDVVSRSYDVISNNDETHKFETVGTDVPEYAISVGAVTAESADIVRAIFDAIHKGKQIGKNIVALRSSRGNKYWMELSYTIIFDNNKKPMTAILALDDVTEKVQADALLNISKIFLNYSNNTTKLLVVNLTTKTIIYETEGPHGLLAHITGSADAPTALKYVVNHLTVPEDKEACTAFLSEEHFVQAYNDGVTEETFEYRGYTADNHSCWMNVQTRLVQDTYTKDIIVYAVFSDVNEQKLAEMELMRRAQTDSLTGLLNRESFEAELSVRLKRLEEQDGDGLDAIVMIDIDKFKSINDIYGHVVGDEALKQVARRVKKGLRDDDIVARFGGDEFILLLPHMPSYEMIEQRCVKICAELNFKLTDDFFVSASIGIAVYPEDGSNLLTLLEKADIAMYQAKSAGSNRCVRYTDTGMHQIVPEGIASPTHSSSKSVFARTFGYFDLFVDGAPLYFTSAKEKELLALLIDRNGGTLTADEAITYLWEDEPAGAKQNTRYRKLAMNLKKTLQAVGVQDILVVNRGVRSIDVSKLKCDYFQFLEGNPEFRALYHGAYMTNYSWSEDTVATLNNIASLSKE